MGNVRTALVVGGGIAGPVTAMALRRVGIEATVYEAYHRSADGAGGALTLAPNGMSALAAIGVDDRVRMLGMPTTLMVMRSGAGRRLGETAALPGLPASRTLRRADLYTLFREIAAERGVRTAQGRRLVAVEQSASQVTAHFADGSSASADILVGADGIRSTVRSLIDPAAPAPRYTGLLGLGGWLVDGDLPGTGGAMHLVFGRRAFFGYQVGDDGQVMWFANLPRRDPLTGEQARAVPADDWLRQLCDLYADDRMPALDILRRTPGDELVNTGAMEDLPRVPTWHRGRVVLVGDSAHATSPSSGQGASMAAESAVELARCLRDLPDFPAAFAAYERLRRPRVERVIAAGARVNQGKAAGAVGRMARDLLMPLAMRTVLTPERMFGWVHRHSIDWDCPVSSTTG